MVLYTRENKEGRDPFIYHGVLTRSTDYWKDSQYDNWHYTGADKMNIVDLKLWLL